MTIYTKSGKLMGLYLSPELYKRIFQVLLDCEEFDTTMRLQGDLTKYNRIFEYPHKTKEKFVESTINYFIEQSIKKPKPPVFPYFLMALYNTLGEDNELRDELEMLHTLVEIELDEIVNSQAHMIAKITPIIHPMLPPSPSSPPPVNPVSDVFLDQADRDKIIQIIIEIFDAMGNDHDGKKSLLRYSGLPDFLINTINFNAAPGNLADTVIGYLEKRDKQDVSMTCLENLISNIVNKIYQGTESETNMKKIIVRYNQKRNLYASNAQSHKGYIRLKPEEYAIDKQFQEARDTNSRTSFQVSPKLDIHRIIQCNLDPQRTSFITGFNGSYNGFFTFAVASVEYSVLMNYVLKSLLWELEKRTNSRATVHSISLYLEDLNLSDVERGTISLQKRISQFFRGKSLRDVLEDTQEANLVIIFSWNKNVMPPHFKDIVRLFSETIKQQVGDILQNRYLILFWAHYGSAPIEPLDVSVTLPTFERFKVEHVIGWLDNSLRSQLKAQNIPEQDIKLWRERLVEKIKDHDGRLPGTYEVLLESLERGGAF